MALEKLVSVNEDLIEKFNIKAYREQQNYAVVGALAALEITNEVQKCYIKNIDIDKTIDEALMNLYGMLQSLFVSVDGLYALSYELGGSKKFINLNQNNDMRELKHIRNDIVGHPANRNLRSKGNAYCILEKDKLSSKALSYLICSERGYERRNINLVSLINSYYEEANSLLKTLYDLSNTTIQNEYLCDLANKALRAYPDLLYKDYLAELYKTYLEKYPNASKKQHRFIWRYELINKVIEYEPILEDEEIKGLKDDILFMEILKAYNIITGKPLFDKYIHKYNTLVKAMYRFLRKNPDLYHLKDYLIDYSHPLFYDTFLKFRKRSAKNPCVTKYLDLINDLINKDDGDLIYAYMLPVKDFKIK